MERARRSFALVFHHVVLGFQADAERFLEIVHLLLGGLLRRLALLGGLRGSLLLRLFPFSPPDYQTRGCSIGRALAGIVAGDFTDQCARRRTSHGPLRTGALPGLGRLLLR